ncbi:MAG: ATP-binding protein [Bacteroidetes bacterium]|nr:ATP-binding protein [Bacteroidota bacterium]MBK8344773.1 ATP-binding protein [Bacteroidota bacterium]
MIHKIVFTGPESCGKTTLVNYLSQKLSLPYVPEMARPFISSLNRKYEYDDLLSIAMLQMSEEERIKSLNPPLLICDTDLLTIKIWCDDKYQRCEPWLSHATIDRVPAVYFLCAPDFPWQPDPQREDPHRREHLYNVYKEHMIKYKVRFVELKGTVEQRMQTVMQYLDNEPQQLY